MKKIIFLSAMLFLGAALFCELGCSKKVKMPQSSFSLIDANLNTPS